MIRIEKNAVVVLMLISSLLICLPSQSNGAKIQNSSIKSMKLTQEIEKARDNISKTLQTLNFFVIDYIKVINNIDLTILKNSDRKELSQSKTIANSLQDQIKLTTQSLLLIDEVKVLRIFNAKNLRPLLERIDFVLVLGENSFSSENFTDKKLENEFIEAFVKLNSGTLESQDSLQLLESEISKTIVDEIKSDESTQTSPSESGGLSNKIRVWRTEFIQDALDVQLSLNNYADYLNKFDMRVFSDEKTIEKFVQGREFVNSLRLKLKAVIDAVSSIPLKVPLLNHVNSFVAQFLKDYKSVSDNRLLISLPPLKQVLFDFFSDQFSANYREYVNNYFAFSSSSDLLSDDTNYLRLAIENDR